MTSIPFMKMHGLGNDFVLLDARRQFFDLGVDQVCAIANRHTGVGCDQLIIIEPAKNKGADVLMRIYNADGGEVSACGNATRCVAATVMKERGTTHAVIESAAGLLDVKAMNGGLVSVDMGPANLDWRDIPLVREMDTAHLGITVGPLQNPVAVNVGNPHAVFFVVDAGAVPLECVGPEVEHHELFPERTNVEVAQVLSPDEIRVRVWERGVGITQACGTGACATLVAACRRGLTERAAKIHLDGGTLSIEWREDGHVLMVGPVATSFHGTLDDSLLS
jgi:diaminopimelate epimerase